MKNIFREIRAMMVINIGIMVAFICGCTEEYVWTHPYKNQQQFYADKTDCRMLANNIGANYKAMQPPPLLSTPNNQMTAFTNGFVNAQHQAAPLSVAKEAFQECMCSRGWRYVKNQSGYSKQEQIDAYNRGRNYPN